MSAPAVVGATSVIIPCWNQVEYTRQCVSALSPYPPALGADRDR